MTTDAISGVYGRFMPKNGDNVQYYGTTGRMTPAEREQQRIDAAIARELGRARIAEVREQIKNDYENSKLELERSIANIERLIKNSDDNEVKPALQKAIEQIKNNKRYAGIDSYGEVKEMSDSAAKSKLISLYNKQTGRSIQNDINEHLDNFTWGFGQESKHTITDWLFADKK